MKQTLNILIILGFSLLSINVFAINVTVRGNSMSPYLKHGQQIKMSAFKNQKIKRHDLVVFNYKKKKIIKRIVALYKDKVELKKNCDHIFVNNKILTTIAGLNYCITRKSLQMFIKTYKNIMPKDHNIVLGEIKEGSEDSTLFGFIDKSQILMITDLRPYLKKVSY